MRLLLVEDNAAGRRADRRPAAPGYAVDWLADGATRCTRASEPYDLIILDLGLPGLPGLDVLAQWRAAAWPRRC
jgi:DNA-binding response OmpR family regulator